MEKKAMNEAIQTGTGQDELGHLIEQANNSNTGTADVIRLRRYLKAHPEVWGNLTTIASTAKEGALQRLQSSALIEMTRIGMKALETEIGYDEAPALERLLIEHISLAWMNYHYIQFLYDATTERESITMKQAGFWERRLSVAQRRYVRAIESLARLRRMSIPAIQVNIGKNQLNVNHHEEMEY